MSGMILAAVVIGITGLAIGLLLGFAGKKFAVDTDERVILVREALPGNNCGGCGYPGCDGLAEAIANGEAAINACPVGGADMVSTIGEIMGTSASISEKKVAFVKCNGTCDKTTVKYNYYGIQDCKKLALIPGGGDKACRSGCVGYGSCVRSCKFDAIRIVDGIAVVDKEKCVACEKCVAECPSHLIEMIPYDSVYKVQCNSHDKGKMVKTVCDVGCIGCGICVKQCEFDAIVMDNNLAYINQEKCTKCGKCAQKCPTKIISSESL